MLRQQTEEGKQFIRQPLSAAEQIRLTEQLLHREYQKMARWRYPFIRLAGVNEAYATGFLSVIEYLVTSGPAARIPHLAITPSDQWVRGVHTLIALSEHVGAEEAIRPLLEIARLESLYFYLNRDTFAPQLYERLARLLSRLTDFTPDSKEHLLLQRIVLNSKRYPDRLRIAALLILGEQPQRLSQSFRKKLESLQVNAKNEAFRMASSEVLKR